MRRLWSIEGNSQRLDGGAMFGNVPRALWERWVKPDAEHRIPLSCRAMLVDDDGRKLLFETGIGVFFAPKLKARFGVVEDEHVLLRSLAEVGVKPGDIDVVVLSHLHFDHAGGLLSAYRADHDLELVFPRAKFVVGRAAWERAQKPHPRDRASFIPELTGLLETSGRLVVVDGPESAAFEQTLGPGFSYHLSDGHTPGLLLTEVAMPDGPVVYAGDLIPGAPWVHAPITMGYDRYPELLIDEKTALLDNLVGRRGRLFFTHDHDVALARVTRDERGRFVPTEPSASVVELTA